MQQNKFQRIAVVLIIVVGMGLISYPLFSSIVNSFRQDDVVTTYDTVVSSLNSDDIEKAYEDAQAYNESLISSIDRFEHTDVYNTLPGIVEDGMIGYVDIPKIVRKTIREIKILYILDIYCHDTIRKDLPRLKTEAYLRFHLHKENIHPPDLLY